jgi:hypothetical protein
MAALILSSFILIAVLAYMIPAHAINHVPPPLLKDNQASQKGIGTLVFAEATLTWSLNNGITSFSLLANASHLSLGSNPNFYISFAFSKDQKMVYKNKVFFT